MRPARYDGLIREIYLAGKKGPLRVALGQGSYPPYLRSGDVALLERNGVEGTRPGEFIGVQDTHGDVRLLRFLKQQGDDVRVLAPARVEQVPRAQVLGRATAIERDGQRQSLDAAATSAALLFGEMVAQGKRLQRRVGLQASLGSLYWDLVDAFETGISETGDVLVTDRCSVGCRFCIYSCVPAGHEMEPRLAGRAAKAFREAGVPKIRILGGEPFMNVPHLAACYREIRASYAPEDIIILSAGHFGVSEESTRAKLDPLRAEGLKVLHLSFDVFHLERYPVACYERVLDYCHTHGIEAALVVHYSVGLAADLETLLALRKRHPFQVRITMVSREGDAKLLKESETSVAGFEEFRDRVLDEPGIELLSEERHCFRWTVFPEGDVHFCCKQNEQNRVGNLERDAFPDLQTKLRGVSARNRLNVLRFATCPTGEVTGNACLTCPLEAHA